MRAICMYPPQTLLQHARHQSVSGNQTHSRSMSVQGSPGIMSPGQGGSYMLTPTTAGRKLSTQKSNDTAEKEVAKGTKRKGAPLAFLLIQTY